MVGLTNFGGNSSKPNSEAGKFFCPVSDSKYCIFGSAGRVVSVPSLHFAIRVKSHMQYLNG